LQTDVRITDAAKILKLINRIGRQMGRRATMREPRLNAPIEGGRMHAAVAPVAASGNCMTLRLFGDRGLGPADLVGNSTITAEALAFLKLAVLSDANILVCGNTGSGKTTLLNVLAGFFPERERIIVVEETPEMRINHDHCVRLCVHDGLDIGMHELVTDTLRMRPDRVIVGEVRTAEEARALMDTMLAGQGKSSLATFHSQNSDEALVRLRQLGLGAADLCSLDLVVVQRRWTLNSEMPRDVRRVTEISSVKKDYAAGAGVEQVYAYEPARDALVRKGGGPDIRGKIRASFGLDEKGLERLLAGTAKGLAADA
jgi:Flp pilus assembly CpaF family ATPase